MTNIGMCGSRGVGFRLLVLAFAVLAGPADAARTGRCQTRAQQAGRRSVGTALACLADRRRNGDMDASACRANAAALLALRMSRTGAACGADPTALGKTVDACISSVLAGIPDGGQCAARKLTAAKASFGLAWDRPGAAWKRLRRAFARAGDCAGRSRDVTAAIAACVDGIDAASDPSSGTLSPPDPDEQVVAFGSYEGDGISTTSVVGQDDVTDTARVVIEPGTTPLYVVLSSYESTIWRFEGATGRVRHVVTLGPGRQGLTGIRAGRLADLTHDAANVPLWDDGDSADGRAARAAVEALLGHPVDVFAGAYEVGTLRLPSATVTVPDPGSFDDTPAGFDPWLYLDATWYSPGGLVDVDSSAVVPAVYAEPYVVVPQEFGLAQLVASGGLESRDEYFYIAQPIPRFPAGLYGAHAVSFVLGRGVPMPPGDPGHSCVVSEETGRPVDGTLCYDFPPPTPGTCDLPAVHADDRVVLFGAYEGDMVSTAAVAGQDEPTRTARVVVAEGTSPLYVVLSAFDAMIWRFEGATSRVRQVVLVGVRPDGVTGLPSDVVADRTQAVGSLTDARCFRPFWDVQSPEGVSARGAVESALGRTVDTFAASYVVGTLTLPSATVAPTPPSATAPPGFDPAVYPVATRFVPGGVVAVDAAAVVPGAEPYVVLPEAFGLAQLTASGALELRNSSEIFPVFYIARPIPRFPAGLYGAEAVAFTLGRGVPMPAGSPGHSCVVSEETGKPLANDDLCPYAFGTE